MPPFYQLRNILLWWEHKLKSSNHEVARVHLPKENPFCNWVVPFPDQQVVKDLGIPRNSESQAN